MENENQSVEQSVEQVSAPESAPEVTESKPDPTVAERIAAISQSKAAPKVEAQPSFVPNFKYKAYEKDYEIPEQFRSLIKDDASQTEIRKIFEKATGFDGLMPKYQRSKSNLDLAAKEYTDYKTKADPILSVYDEANKYLGKKDYDSLMELLGIEEKGLQEWMYRKLNLTDGQKDAYNREREAIKRQYELENQQVKQSQEVSSYRDKYEDLLVQQRTQELQSVLSRPEIAEIASQFDAKQGQQGAFLKEVVQRAILHHTQTGEELNPEQAATNVYNLYKSFFTTASPEATAKKAENAVVNSVHKKDGVPVIPNVGSRQASPIGKQITSMEDLRAAAKSRLSSG